jgi:PAS domain S-box-containing protein
VLDSLTAQIAVLDQRGVIILVNANWQRFADENGGDVNCQPGVNYLTVCNRVMSGQDGVDAQAALQGIQQVLARTRDTFNLIYSCDSPTEQRWFEMRVLPLSGAQLGAVIAHEDITTQMLAQRALQASEQRLQRVLDGANDGFWDWNVATGEQQMNRRWAEMLGYTLDEIAPSVKSWEQRVHPDDLPACLAAVQAHFSGATPYYQSEHRLRTKDGGWCWILARGRVTARDAAGQPTWMAGTHTDISERRVIEAQLCVSLAVLKRHDAQMSALNHMNDLLLSCLTREEAYPIIAQGAAALFADMFGTLAVSGESNGTEEDLRCVAVWGDAADWLPSTFSPHECWALRRGKLHEVSADGDALACQHVLDHTPPTFFCVPLTVRGTTLGLLHIGSHTALDANRFRELRTLAIAVSESIKLALSNLQFQETLRDLPKAQN